MSVREQAAILRRPAAPASRRATFRSLTADCDDDAAGRGAVPRAARALPEGAGRLRPGHAAGRAARPLDRAGGGRGRGGCRGVRGCPASRPRHCRAEEAALADIEQARRVCPRSTARRRTREHARHRDRHRRPGHPRRGAGGPLAARRSPARGSRGGRGAQPRRGRHVRGRRARGDARGAHPGRRPGGGPARHRPADRRRHAGRARPRPADEVLEPPPRPVRGLHARRAAASTCARWPAAGASTPAPTAPRSSSGTSATASRPGSRRRRSRRWPWSPTASR